ncbi:MAG: 5'/3'-nucleotidase SurE [Deltaproteobacteria bacterium]|nr:5'/3'-nucleotidase SurE [Deltaproteobacteria bacterium]MCZ6625818.1 5'/3'-nucleotidase SurE [Deltaproteobacteria bacterium]
MIILVSNDDGIHSEGVLALEEVLQRLGNVYTVAPDREQNSMSHALTLHRPLRVQEVGPRRFAVDGTPTDCVKLALGLLPERPRLVVSGINKGPNLGDDIIYSGTVSAAIEGTLMNIPSIAVSLVTFRDFVFNAAAEFTVTLASRILEKGLPPGTLLNVNVPPVPKHKLKGWRLTRQGKRHYSEEIVERVDPRGKKYYWIGGDDLGFAKEEGTDCVAVDEGFISVTPLQIDLTNHRVFQEIQLLTFPWP